MESDCVILHFMQKIINHFKKVDSVLFSAIKNFEFPISHRGSNYFADLCEIIIQQQLSEKAGDTIFGRFKKLFPLGKISPENLVKLKDDEIRMCGTSNMKVKYLKNLARQLIKKEFIWDRLEELDDEEIITELTKIKGVGRWSADMFLMFSLGREDVFSYGDLGLRRAIQKLYKLKKEPSMKQAEKIAIKWRPYRTYACRILWRSLAI